METFLLRSGVMRLSLSRWFLVALTAAIIFSCVNPVVETKREEIPLGPANITVQANLPSGTPENLSLVYLAWLKSGTDEFIESTDVTPPFQFSGVVPGPYTLKVFGKINGVVYFQSTQQVNISSTTTLTANLSPTRALPVRFNPASAAVASGTKVYLNTPTAGARIRYTTDNSTPSESSSLYTAEGITINAPTTIKARAYVDGLDPSGVTESSYSVDSNVVASPVFIPTAETFSGVLDVNISTATSGATIEYRLNDSTPQTYTAPIQISATTTIRAIAKKAGMTNSPEVVKTYTRTGGLIPNPPLFSRDSGEFDASFQLTLSADPGVTILYTTNGQDPNPGSPIYSAPITIPAQTTTVKARSEQAGNLSAIVTKTYTYNPANTPSPEPTIAPISGNYTPGMTVTLSHTDGTATIYYTTDGTDPTTSSTQYSSPFTLNQQGVVTVKARAKVGTRPLSNVVSETYVLQSGGGNIRIYLYQESSTPKIWLWEVSGRAIMELEGFTWPGPNMTREGTSNWYYYEIPSNYYPLNKNLGMKFNGSDPEINLTAPVTSSYWRKNNQWYTSNPDAPSVSATPGTSTFYSTSVGVTLLANDVTDAEYKIGNGNWTSYTNNQQITLGEGLSSGQSITLSLRSLAKSLSQSYTYTKGDSGQVVSIYFKKTSGPAPKICYWEEGGRALAQLKGFTWPGPEMTNAGGGWWKYDIPADLYPLTLPLKVHFDGGSALTRNPPTTGWYNGSSWSNDNPDPPAAPSVSLSPNGGWFEASSVSVTPSITTDPRAPLSSTRYKINNGSWVNYTNGNISVPLGPNQGDTTTLTVEATNSAGTTSVSAQFRKGTQPLPSFSWKNANVYFVITDRFFDGNPSNNNSYGRPQVDATGKNIGTFHGGDIPGLKAKLDANYFTDLGINVIWITAPYEQAHGFVGGGSSGDFAHYAYHGYYALDFSNIDANMGTRQQFKEFVDAAHAKGIRIILDIVMNHSGYPTLKDMQDTGFNPTKNSNFSWTPGSGQNWFGYHDAVLDYTNTTEWGKWWGDWVRAGLPGYTPPGGGDLTMSLAYLPDFKTEDTTLRPLPTFLQNKSTYGGAFENGYTKTGTRRVRDWIADWLSQWVREYGIDGFRVDTAKHVEMDSWLALRSKATQALQDWRQAQAAKPETQRAPGWDWQDSFWMVAEVWGHGPSQSPYHTVQGGAFDSVINFAFQGAVGKSGSGPGAASSWESTFAEYANAVNSNPNSNWNFLSYISSHDTGAVFRKDKTDDQQKRAGSMLLLAPGGVQVFYGDEYGRANGDGGSDQDQGSRSSMNWTEITSQAGNTNSILNHWRRVGRFRNRNIAVGAGTHQQISATGAPYAFVRNWQNTNKVAVAIDASATTVTFTLPNGFWADGTQVRDYYTGNTATVNNNQVTISGVTVGSPVLLQHSSIPYP